MIKKTFEKNVRETTGFKYRNYYDAGYFDYCPWYLKGIIHDISERLEKLEILTKANDYEWKTIKGMIKGSITKLVKKENGNE